MGYKQIDQNMTFAEVSILSSMEHNRSHKKPEKINRVINWKSFFCLIIPSAPVARVPTPMY
jgi:hypothetical protein